MSVVYAQEYLGCEALTSVLSFDTQGNGSFQTEAPCGLDGALCANCYSSEYWAVKGWICYLCEREWELQQPSGFFVDEQERRRGWIHGTCQECQQQAEAGRSHYGTWEHEQTLIEFEQQEA